MGTNNQISFGEPQGDNEYADDYAAQVVHCLGQALEPTSFGEYGLLDVGPKDLVSSGLFDALTGVVPDADTWEIGTTTTAGTGTLDKSGAGGTSARFLGALTGDFTVSFTARYLHKIQYLVLLVLKRREHLTHHKMMVFLDSHDRFILV